jgi:hypothetical protein
MPGRSSSSRRRRIPFGRVRAAARPAGGAGLPGGRLRHHGAGRDAVAADPGPHARGAWPGPPTSPRRPISPISHPAGGARSAVRPDRRGLRHRLRHRPRAGGDRATWHVTAPFWLAAGLAALNFVFGLFILPESLKRENRRPFGARDLNPFGTIFGVPRAGARHPADLHRVFEFANMVYPTLWAFWGREVFRLVDAGDRPVAVGLWGADGRCPGGVMPFRGGSGWASAAGDLGLVLRSVVARGVRLRRRALDGGGASADRGADRPRAADADGDVGQYRGEDRQGMVQGVIASLSSLLAVVSRPLVFTPFVRLWFISGEIVGAYLPGAPYLYPRFSPSPPRGASDSACGHADAARSAAPHAVRIEPLVDRHQRRRVEER